MYSVDVPSVAPAEVAARLQEGWTLLDVRTDEEWAGAHIADAVHIPMDTLIARLDEVDDQVICVCAVGARSARVAQYLISTGKTAVNLDGGLHAWAAEGRPLVA